MGKYEEARQQQEIALACHRAAGSKLGEANTKQNLAHILLSRGRAAEALRLLDDSISITRKIGTRRLEAYVRHSRSVTLDALGRSAESLQEAHAVRQLAMEMDMPGIEIAARNSVADHLVCAGHPEEALALLGDGALSESESRRARQDAFVLSTMAAAEAELENPRRAAGYYEQSIEALRARCETGDLITILTEFGDFLIRDGKPSEGRAALHEGLQLARRLGLRSDETVILSLLAPISEAHRATALTRISDAEAQVSHRFRIRARFALWEATGEPEHLAEAKRLLDYLVEHAPEAYRESMLKNVRLNREIMEAWAEHGETAGSGESAT